MVLLVDLALRIPNFFRKATCSLDVMPYATGSAQHGPQVRDLKAIDHGYVSAPCTYSVQWLDTARGPACLD